MNSASKLTSGSRKPGKPPLVIMLEITSRAYGNSTLEAKQGEATLYLVEVKQAGVFSISGASTEDLKRLIGSFCPSVLFPYAREVISNMITKGGFPGFLLPLVNFEALFMQASETPSQPGLVN